MADEDPKPAATNVRWVTPIRLTAFLFAACVTGIVFMSYHYTGAAFASGIELLAAAETADEARDAVIQMLGAVAQNMVALTAVGGLVGAIVKLCE